MTAAAAAVVQLLLLAGCSLLVALLLVAPRLCCAISPYIVEDVGPTAQMACVVGQEQHLSVECCHAQEMELMLK
jgi:hypothetical protein